MRQHCSNMTLCLFVLLHGCSRLLGFSSFATNTHTQGTITRNLRQIEICNLAYCLSHQFSVLCAGPFARIALSHCQRRDKRHSRQTRGDQSEQQQQRDHFLHTLRSLLSHLMSARLCACVPVKYTFTLKFYYLGQFGQLIEFMKIASIYCDQLAARQGLDSFGGWFPGKCVCVSRLLRLSVLVRQAWLGLALLFLFVSVLTMAGPN